MGNSAIIALISLGSIAVVLPAFAHCPLCTAGAGVLAVLAASMGVSLAVVGVFIGAFALALGIWLARSLKKKYVKYQEQVVSLIIFLLTVIPIIPFADEYRSFSIYWIGDYGSLLNRTYIVNNFIFGSIAGALLLLIAPFISRKITQIRQGKAWPYQGITITFILLLAAALAFQFIL